MSGYRVEFHAKGDVETLGLPEAAFTALFETLVAVSRDPWATSSPEDTTGDPGFRWVSFDRGLGVVYFVVNDAAKTVRVHGVTWTG